MRMSIILAETGKIQRLKHKDLYDKIKKVITDLSISM